MSNRTQRDERTSKIALAVLILMALGVVLVPVLAPSDSRDIGDVLGGRFLPPGSIDTAGHFHLLGTDRFGRDLFIRVMLAGRLSLAVGVLGSLLAGVVGVTLGATAAARGGGVERSIMAMADLLLAVPRLVLLLVCAALWPPSAALVVVILVATGWMGVARLVRSDVNGLRHRPFVEAVRALGASNPRVLWRHLVPNALGPAIVAVTLGVGNAVLLESGLSFLGLGIQPPEPSWGNMIAEGREAIVTAPWPALAPGVALIVTVICCTLLGDALHDTLAGERTGVSLTAR